MNFVYECFDFAMAEEQARRLAAIQPGTRKAVKEITLLKEKVNETFYLPLSKEEKAEMAGDALERFFSGYMSIAEAAG